MKNDRFSKSALRQELFNKLASIEGFEHLANSMTISKAYDIAFQAHADQVRASADGKSGDIPYIVHPVGVAYLSAKHWINNELDEAKETVVAAALVHDVLEDSSFDYLMLQEALGSRIAEITDALTKPTTSKKLSPLERNAAAAKKIKLAGAIPVYIKACDALHNISRPSNMPYTLLEKTIKKLSGPYMDLLDGEIFSTRFQQLFQIAIANAQRVLASREDNSSSFDPYDFSAFVEYLGKQSSSKILEEHDISSIFSMLPGVLKCTVVEKSNLLVGFLECSKHDMKFLQNKIERDGVLHSPFTKRDTLLENKFNASKFLALPFYGSLVEKDPTYVSFAINDKYAPSWLRPTLVSATLAMATERLRLHQREQSLELTKSIRSLSLDLNPNFALELGMTPSEVAKLSNYRNFGEHLLHALMLHLESSAISMPHSDDIDRFESRIKSMDSALQKVGKRGYSTVEELDDFIGVRLVSPSNSTKSTVVASLYKTLQSFEPLRNAMGLDNQISIENIETAHGYSATHIHFLATAPNNSDLIYGCEIQVRTLFEDAVAKALHSLTYKSAVLSKSQSKNLANQLRAAQTQADKALDSISISAKKNNC